MTRGGHARSVSVLFADIGVFSLYLCIEAFGCISMFFRALFTRHLALWHGRYECV